MTSAFFVVVDMGDGSILRTGQCWPEDAPLQGDTVIVFDQDPFITAQTHRWDVNALQFTPLGSEG